MKTSLYEESSATGRTSLQRHIFLPTKENGGCGWISAAWEGWGVVPWLSSPEHTDCGNQTLLLVLRVLWHLSHELASTGYWTLPPSILPPTASHPLWKSSHSLVSLVTLLIVISHQAMQRIFTIFFDWIWKSLWLCQPSVWRSLLFSLLPAILLSLRSSLRMWDSSSRDPTNSHRISGASRPAPLGLHPRVPQACSQDEWSFLCHKTFYYNRRSFFSLSNSHLWHKRESGKWSPCSSSLQDLGMLSGHHQLLFTTSYPSLLCYGISLLLLANLWSLLWLWWYLRIRLHSRELVALLLTPCRSRDLSKRILPSLIMGVVLLSF